MEKAPLDTKQIVSTLLDGLTVSSRKDGTVHTIKREKATVAEVCVGTRAVRLNLRNAPAKNRVPKSIKLVGKSKSWPGGGVVVTAENATAARAVLSAVAA
jgi:hypothetical protein